MTVETTPLLTESEARRLTLRIGLLLDSAAGVLDNLSASIREARDRRADLALGYESWAEYATAEFGDRTAGLAPAIRRELVASLSVEVEGSPALSTRQIAPAVGVSRDTISKDRARQVSDDLTPALAIDVNADRASGVQELNTSEQTVQEAPRAAPAAAVLPPFDPATGEVLDAPAPRPAVLGLDGKTYTPPEPKPRRSALIDAIRPQAERVWNAAIELRGAVGDDRFSANRTSISEVVLPRVRAAALDLTAFLAELDLSPATETEEARDRLAADLNHISETYARLARSLMEDQK